MNETMLRVCRGYIGLTSGVLILNGLMWALFPSTNLDMYSIGATDPLALNMIKSDIGGSLLAVGILGVLFLRQGSQFYLPLMIFTVSLASVRTISIAVDGFHLLSAVGVVMEGLFAWAVHTVDRSSRT